MAVKNLLVQVTISRPIAVLTLGSGHILALKMTVLAVSPPLTVSNLMPSDIRILAHPGNDSEL
jgi:hypothetical protein